MKLLPLRKMTADSLPERSFLSGKGNNKSCNILRRISERSLVRKISSSLRTHDRGDDDCDFSTIHSSCDECDPKGILFLRDLDESEERSHSSCSGLVEEPTDSSFSQTHDDCLSLPSGLLPLQHGCGDAPSRLPMVAPLHRKELVVEELLGAGTFSHVYAVSDLCLKPTVDPRTAVARQQLHLATSQGGDKLVVKHLSRKLLRSPKQFYQAALHLKQEANILSQLEHPHIVKLRAVALGGTLALQSGRYNEFFLVLDRLADTLEDRIEEWKSFVAPGLTQKVLYAQQLASALAYLHEHRLIFRDVKPPNVGFLAAANGQHDRLQLFDFGFCRMLPPRCFHAAHADLETFQMSLAGTTRYMAPEIISHGGYNCKADCYSWAMTVYEMIAQEKPYADLRANHFQELVCHTKVRPNLNDNRNQHLKYVPTAIKTVLEEAWCASVEQRLSMAGVVERLKPIVETLQKHELEPRPRRSTCSGCSSTNSTTAAPMQSSGLQATK
jgi:serine/threonine protein kinase